MPTGEIGAQGAGPNKLENIMVFRPGDNRLCPEKSARARNRGQIVFIVAAGMAVLGGLAGLVFDGGMLYYEKRRMQSAADAGAMGGAWEIVRGNTDLAGDIRPASVNDTTLNGYTDANSTITVNNPPATGPNTGNARYVEVIIERPLDVSFMRILGFSDAIVRARGVAGCVNIGDACVIALDRNAPAALNFRGNSEINADCGAFSNSCTGNGLQTDGDQDVTFTYNGVCGGYMDNGGAGYLYPTPTENVPPILDPLAWLKPPPQGTMPAMPTLGYYDAATWTYKCPNKFCVFNNKLDVAGPPGNKTFESGIYILRGGFDIGSSNVVTGNQVMFYNTGELGYGFRTSGSAQVTFTAPTSGYYKGVLMYTNPSAGYLVNELGVGTSDFKWTGAIYTPSQGLRIEGTTLGANPWALMIAATVDFAGTSTTTLNAPPVGEAPEMLRVAMAE